MKALIISLLSLLFMGFTLCSMLLGSVDEAFGDGCAHESIASYNPAYELGCALFKKRWKAEYPNRPNGYCDPNAGECDTGKDDDDDYDPTQD